MSGKNTQHPVAAKAAEPANMASVQPTGPTGGVAIGNNVIMVEDGDHLVLRINKALAYGFTGKGEGNNISIATTGGNKKIRGLTIGVNVYREPTEAELATKMPRA